MLVDAFVGGESAPRPRALEGGRPSKEDAWAMEACRPWDWKLLELYLYLLFSNTLGSEACSELRIVGGERNGVGSKSLLGSSCELSSFLMRSVLCPYIVGCRLRRRM